MDMKFDSSRLDTQPGGTLQGIGEAAGILSGSQARSESVAKMAKRGGRTESEYKKFKKDKKDKKAAKKLIAKTTFNLKTGLLREGNKAAVSLARESAKGSIVRKNEAAKRRTDTVKANNAVKVEGAKQATRSTPIARTPAAKKPGKARIPAANKSVGAPKPPRPTK
jgi:hypothetical protein